MMAMMSLAIRSSLCKNMLFSTIWFALSVPTAPSIFNPKSRENAPLSDGSGREFAATMDFPSRRYTFSSCRPLNLKAMNGMKHTFKGLCRICTTIFSLLVPPSNLKGMKALRMRKCRPLWRDLLCSYGCTSSMNVSLITCQGYMRKIFNITPSRIYSRRSQWTWSQFWMIWTRKRASRFSFLQGVPIGRTLHSLENRVDLPLGSISVNRRYRVSHD